jgi:hypothetical protein
MKNPSPAATASRSARLDLARIQQSRAYDALMRLPMAAWAMFVAMFQVIDLQHYMAKADPMPPGTLYAINIAMRVSGIAFLILIATSVLLRGRPAGKARGIEPRISALIGTFLITAIVLFPRRELSPAAGIVSTLLILAAGGDEPAGRRHFFSGRKRQSTSPGTTTIALCPPAREDVPGAGSGRASPPSRAFAGTTGIRMSASDFGIGLRLLRREDEGGDVH